jgi:hypothetical protein
VEWRWKKEKKRKKIKGGNLSYEMSKGSSNAGGELI